MHRKTVIDFRALGERYIFTQPIKELKTRDVAEVADLLAQVESYQEQGYYVVGYVSYEAAPAFEEKLAVHKAPLLGNATFFIILIFRQKASPVFPGGPQGDPPRKDRAWDGRISGELDMRPLQRVPQSEAQWG